MTKKLSLKLNAYNVISDDLEGWLRYGIRRYYKYRDEPSIKDEEAMVQELYKAVMDGLSDRVDWEKSG